MAYKKHPKPADSSNSALWLILILSLVLGLILLLIGVPVTNAYWSGVISNSSVTMFGFFIGVLAVNYYLEKKKQAAWEPVKQEVYKDLRNDLQGLFYDITMFADDPGVDYVVAGQNDPSWRSAYHEKAKNFAEKETLPLSEFAKEGFRKGGWEHLFKIRMDQVNSFRQLYSKYFDPIITISLMHIARALNDLDVIASVYVKNKPEEEARLFKDMEVLCATIAKNISVIDQELDLFSS